MSHWPFSVLGVDPDAEPRDIKRAYARLLKVTHPEDDPAGFQALRAAYEAASNGYWTPPAMLGGEDVLERPLQDEAQDEPASEAIRPSTLVPASASVEEELWELRHELLRLVSGPAASDDDRRAALGAVLTSPALENVSWLTEVEAWLGSLIVDYPGPADSLLDAVIRRFDWDAQRRRLDIPWFVAAALERRDALAVFGRLHDRKGPYHAGYRLLQKPPPRMVFLKSRKVEAVLRLLDEQPGLVNEFDYGMLEQWRERIDAMPFKPPQSWSSAFGMLFFVLWIGLMISKCAAPDWGGGEPRPQSAYQVARAAAEACHEASRATTLRSNAQTLCEAAGGNTPEASLTTQDAGSLIAARQGKWRNAEGGWDAVLRVSPGDARALYGRGFARYKFMDPRGVADMEQALAIDAAVAREFAALGLAQPVEVIAPPPGQVPGIIADERMRDVTMVRPHWAMSPTAQQLNEAYPARAARKGVSGRMSLNCAINAALRLDDCIVLYETPQGLGFSDAALALSRHFQAAPWPDGQERPRKPRVQMPINFRMEGETA